ncbi:hypothetical protein [Paracidovorax konjaci]|uniref:hypothetical protein n=1 Tax=Paracidovorax konjaci TaxID=32040 RepID=UPI0011140D20|nr:hypothetical protein [Paracidovorax konjaci]
MLFMRVCQLGLAVFGLALCVQARAQSAEEVLAAELSYCTVIATYISTNIPTPATAEQANARAGWQRKALIFNGSAALLTSQELAKVGADAATSRFLEEAGRDKEQDIKLKFRTWMTAIDRCEAKLIANKERLLEIAASRRNN